MPGTENEYSEKRARFRSFSVSDAALESQPLALDAKLGSEAMLTILSSGPQKACAPNDSLLSKSNVFVQEAASVEPTPQRCGKDESPNGPGKAQSADKEPKKRRFAEDVYPWREGGDALIQDATFSDRQPDSLCFHAGGFPWQQMHL